MTGYNGSRRAGALELVSIVESERAHLRRFFFRRLRRRGVLLVSPLCKGVARFPCSFRAVAATLAPVSPSAWLLPCTGGLVRAPAPGPVVAGSSLHTATPPRAASSSARSVRDRGQSPLQPAPDSPWNGNDSTPSSNHVSTVEAYSALRGYDATIRVQSPSPFSHSSLSSATLRATQDRDRSGRRGTPVYRRSALCTLPDTRSPFFPPLPPTAQRELNRSLARTCFARYRGARTRA